MHVKRGYILTAVTPFARGRTNWWQVQVVGRQGTFYGVRRTEVEAHATAAHYQRMFDALPKED